MRKYYSLIKNQEDREADIYIFGDITSWEWLDSDVSSYTLAKELAEMEDVDRINVHINSYGGEVAEGLAIYNQLVGSKAKVATYCDGFACSIASVIFMAGEERIMSDASLLMIHNPWTRAAGNAEELRKEAETLDVIASASINAYMNRTNISEEELKKLLNAETWLTANECAEKGFATAISTVGQSGKISQSARQAVFEKVTKEGTVAKAQINLEEFAAAVVEKLVSMSAKPEATPPAPEKKNQLMQIFKGLK